MTLVLLVSAFAADPELEARLLGPDPEPEVAASLGTTTETSGGVPWSLVALAVGGGVAFVGRKQLWSALGGAGGGEPRAMDVVSRASLGGGSLAVVDVVDRDGEVRRLVVGTGPSGPRLVADLSDPFAHEEAG